MSFFARLQERARQIDSLLCVGLDPHRQDLDAFTPHAARAFCLRLVKSTSDLALAFKPNAAFFEALGPEGLLVLQEVIAAIPEDVPVILDAKRGDIASTAEAYAEAAFESLGADAVTLSPYLGHDSLAPFLKDPQRGAFLLCKTSNQGAADLQDLKLESSLAGEPEMLYERVAALARKWNTLDNLGLVVGATYPAALARVRSAAPDLWILAPGVGAQGGDLRSALQAGLRQDGFGMLVPVARAISRSADPRRAADELRQAIELEREAFLKTRVSGQISSPVGWNPAVERLADGLLAAGCVRFGEFTLKSGLISPIYLDLRRLVSYPDLLKQVAQAYLPILKRLSFDRLAALPYAALPIGAAISLAGDWPLVYPRKEVKEYGTKAEIEGEFKPGERVVVIDDLATTGGSKFEAIEKLASAGLQISDVVVLIDRQSGAAQALAERGYAFHAAFTLTGLLDIWERG
ncbi:MAG: putative Orotidine-5-phosphate decarboxylase/orotate phosphoribosyltransferase, partial [Chloroflexi bacterium]|nr:putative Orotidine-5-phosphate decarboxylase/orotate phosphoribosyltransferase [Chloroflexota bacterium]